MKSIPQQNGQNFTSLHIGSLDRLNDYSFLHPKLNVEVPGKIFTGELLKTTGVEISLQVLKPGGAIGFLHCHRLHEEVYIFLKGNGKFQVDDVVMDVQEGSLVRVAPAGKRTWWNPSDAPLVCMVLQVMQGSLDAHLIADGYRVDGSIHS